MLCFGLSFFVRITTEDIYFVLKGVLDLPVEKSDLRQNWVCDLENF